MESNAIKTLDYLMTIKKEQKKREPSKLERDQFCAAWVELALQTGYSESAEAYLYNGFSYCGAKPFKAFLDKSENKVETLTGVFSGKLYGKDGAVTFRVLVHLLALLLYDKKRDAALLNPIIIRFPGACQTKDKKRSATVGPTMLKYFFDELRPDVQLPRLNELGLKPIFVSEFSAFIKSVISEIDRTGLSKHKLTSITNVQAWVTAEYEQKSLPAHEERAKVEHTQGAPQSHDTPLKQAETAVTESAHAEDTSMKSESRQDTFSYMSDLLEKAGKATALIQQEYIQQKVRIEVLSHSLTDEQEKLRIAQQQITERQEQIVGLQQENMAADAEIITLKQTIAEREAEIAERIKMADVLSRDRSKQSDEVLQRIASKIRIEYRDYLDARELPMDSDLGENMRLQLQNIFDILEKGGMKIK